MTDDLVKQRRKYAAHLRDVGYEPIADAFVEDADRIEQLTAEVERLQTKLAELNDSDVITRTMAENERKDAEIARLREAGTKLAGFAAHDIDCEDLTGAYPGSCSCGYASAWKAWSAALEGKQ